MKRIITYSIGVLASCFSIAYSSYGHEHNANHNGQGTDSKSSISFIENKGQWNAEAKYKAVIPGGEMYITENGFMYNFYNNKDVERIHSLTCGENAQNGKNVDNEVVNMHAYKVNFKGANTSNNITYHTDERATGKTNYFIGNDPTKWASDCGLFNKITLENLYQNIDLAVYTSEKVSNVKYDLIVKANANPSIIQLEFNGVSPTLNSKGELVIKTSVNEIKESAPYTYQIIEGKKVEVASKYVLKDGQLGFEFPNGYNKNFDLVIDPSLIFYTYSGGVNYSFYSYTSGYDKDGNMYTAGDAWGAGWPVTTGAYQVNYGGGSHEVCIMKISSNGANMIWATYYGGSSWDLPHSVWVDNNFEVYVAGSTQSSNLPMHAQAFDNSLGGTWDWFVCKLNSAGSQLLGSTYLGGSGVDGTQFTFTGTSVTSSNSGSSTTPIQLYKDNNNNVWVATNTGSTDFPITASAQYNTNSGALDGVICKLNNNLTSLTYSSYYGGSGNDGFNSIVQQYNGNLVFAGITYSANLPGMNGLQTAMGGTQDGFVCIFNPNSQQIVNATYLGTSAIDHSVDVQVDCGDNVFVLGRTAGNYPVSPGVWSVPTGCATIDKLSSDLSSRILSTRLANPTSTGFMPSSFMVDLCGRIYVGGFGASAGLFTTPDAYDPVSKSFYLITLESNFTSVVYASYFGATTSDHNHIGSHRLDPKGYFYHTICNINQFTPINPAVYKPSIMTSGQDVFSFKFNFDAVNLDADVQSGYGGYDDIGYAVRGCKSAFIKYTRNGDTTVPMVLNYSVIPGGGDIAYNGTDFQALSGSITFGAYEKTKSLEIKPLLVSNMPTGQKMVIIEALNPCGCNGTIGNVVRRDTVYILDSLNIGINSPLPAYCPGDVATIIGEVDTENLEFHWTPAQYDLGNTTINPVLTTTRIFTLTVSQPGAPPTCPKVKRTFVANVEQFPIISMPSDTIVCILDSVAIPVSVSPDSVIYNYNWNPGTGLRATNIGTNFFFQPVGTYSYLLTVSTPIASCTSTKNITINVKPPFELSNVSPASGTVVPYEDEVNMSADGAVLYTWLPVGSYVNPTLQSPTTLPVTQPGYYYVSGIDQYGCRDTAAIWLDVLYPYDPVMPNAFSPNGDNLNDVFSIPNGKYIKVQRFEVYNRWGQKVFSTIDGKKGWNGTDDRNGEACEQGVYMYVVNIELPNKEIKTFKGDVKLIR